MLTLLFVILIIIKFKRNQRVELKLNSVVTKEDLNSLLYKLKGLLTDNINEKSGVDLHKLMLSKIIKYLFTNYAKLSFV